MNANSNAPPLGGPAGMALRPPEHRVSRRAIWYWTVRAVPGWVVLMAAQVAFFLLVRQAPAAHIAVLAVTVVVAVAHLIVMPRWRYAVHRWEATPDAVYTQVGWFDQERRIAPISRVQTVDSERGAVERLFGLANVTVTTASAAGPLRIHGLEFGDAQRLADDITSRAQATRGDAT
ncbi:MAG: PH domain-containing protein [Candidatus Dormibacteraceae bacterium]